MSGVTLASEIIAQSLGCTFRDFETIFPGYDDTNYFEAVRDILSEVQEKIFSGEKIPQLVIYSTAIAASFYDVKSQFWNSILRQIPVSWHRRFIKNGLIRNPGYSGFRLENVDNSISPYSDPIAGPLIQIRQRELQATNVAIALLCSNDGSFALRLPNAVNLHLALLVEIESLHRRSEIKSQKLLQERFSRYSDLLADETKYCKTQIGNAESLKICSDVPLEWMYLDNLPLMISHEVSRLPITSGNMLMQFSAVGSKISIEEAEFRKILIIRSFKEDDSLRTFLEDGIKGFGLAPELTVDFVDVTSKAEVVDALNAYLGQIVVFDCHGHHDGKDGAGWLAIGEDKVNTWELAHLARIPPIVMLSACSTSAITGSHASVANGFLRSGAFSVIGTFMRVDAAESAVFISRILYRIHSFLPAIRKMGVTRLSWRLFISTFLRMSYVTDILRFLENEAVISHEAYMEILKASNMQINALNPDWYLSLIDDIAKRSGINSEKLIKKIRKEQAFVETMLYCHHGRPDLIEIILDSN